MGETWMINNREYTFKKDYRTEDHVRLSFNQLTEETYEFNFENWYQAGYWKSQYIPYSLMDQDEVIANVSVNVIDFMLLGEQKRYVQLGTVMTKESYRHQGLSRALMERVLKEWEANCDLMYLFANDSVLEFYPQFGFNPMTEYQYSTKSFKKSDNPQVRKIDVNKEKDFLYRMVRESKPMAKLSMINNPDLVMFYGLSFMSDQIYYLKTCEAIVIAEVDDETLYLHDVFCKQAINLDEVVNQLTTDSVKKVVFGFTPTDVSQYEKEVLKEEDTTLFVKASDDQTFAFDGLRFPVLSHA